MAATSPIKFEKPKCFVCNEREPLSARHVFKFFDDNGLVKSTSKRVIEILEKMFDITLDRDTAHSDFLCRVCVNRVEEYEDLVYRSSNIKSNLLQKFAETKSICASKHDMNVIALEAKLRPLPQNIVIVNNGKKLHLRQSKKKSIETDQCEEQVETIQNQEQYQTEDLDLISLTPKEENFEIAYNGAGDYEEEAFELDDDTILLEEDENGTIIRVVQCGIELDKNQIKYYPENNEIEFLTTQSEGEAEPDENSNNDGGENTSEHNSTALDTNFNSKDNSEQEENNVPSLLEFTEDGYKCVICVNASENENETDRGESNEDLSTSFIFSKEEIAGHLRSKHQARVYICTYCGNAFSRMVHLNRHYQEKHSIEGGEVVFDEKDSPKKKTSNSTKSEPDTVAADSCAICNKMFINKYTLATHMKTHTIRARPFKCSKCPKAFLSQFNAKNHEKTHSTAKNFKCLKCEKAFSSQHNLEIHSIVHQGEKRFTCSICNKAFLRKPELRDHMRIHTDERPFTCTACNMSFRQKSNLNSHIKATHLQERPHKCPACEKTFKRKRLVDYHYKSCHSGERTFHCEVCSASFVYPEHYRKHMIIHTGQKPYKCEVCGKEFNSRDNRNSHRFVHSDKKPYECLICGAGFMRRPHLYNHMSSQNHVTDTIVVNRPKLASVEESKLATVKDTLVDNDLIQTSDPSQDTDQLEPIVLHDNGMITTLQSSRSTDGSLIFTNATESDIGDLGDMETTDGQQILLTGANGEILTADGTRGMRIVSVLSQNDASEWLLS